MFGLACGKVANEALKVLKKTFSICFDLMPPGINRGQFHRKR